jgi:acetate kinase
MRVLVLNSGSSSVKYQLIESATGERLTGGTVEEVDDHQAALGSVIDALGEETGIGSIEAVGHRVVHGGDAFSAPVLVDDPVVTTIRALIPLAPLHNPANLAGIEAARATWPELDQVAVFDTAFHRTLPEHAYRYAVPAEWYHEHGVRRYGFHGTSHDYVSTRAAAVLGRPRSELRMIVAHLGNGASMSAVSGGRSIDTSMGLSPLEGLVMGTRSGDVDPAVITHIAAATGRPESAVIGDLNRASGLLGLCGASDMRTIVECVDAGDDAAELALEVYCYRIRKYVGAYIAALGGCDALVFTAGIGEHSPEVRARVCEPLGALGIAIDGGRNAASATDITADVPSDGARIRVLVVATDEEHAIAEQTATVIDAARS